MNVDALWLAVLVWVVVWLGLGGWSFYNLNDGRRNVLAGFVVCLILAPFAAGAAVAELQEEKRRTNSVKNTISPSKPQA